ncbi:hypothetical protein ACQJ5K_00290 [Helicobacter pylori]
MRDFNVFYPKRLLYMFHTALKSASLSPLSVLSGVSGTGKSELPKLYLEKYKKITENINENLSARFRSIGHRVWQSMSFYMHNHPLVMHAKNKDDKDKALKFAYEECLVLKIFPKLRGVETRNNQHLIKIKELLKDYKVKADFEKAMENDFNQFVFNSADYLNDGGYEQLINNVINNANIKK